MSDREKAIFMAGYCAGIKSERRASQEDRAIAAEAITRIVFQPWGLRAAYLNQTIDGIAGDLAEVSKVSNVPLLLN